MNTLLANDYTIDLLKRVLKEKNLHFNSELYYYYDISCGGYVVSDRNIEKDGLIFLEMGNKLRGSKNLGTKLKYHTKGWYKSNGYKNVDKLFDYLNARGISLELENPHFKCSYPMKLVAISTFEYYINCLTD